MVESRRSCARSIIPEGRAPQLNVSVVETVVLQARLGNLLKNPQSPDLGPLTKNLLEDFLKTF